MHIQHILLFDYVIIRCELQRSMDDFWDSLGTSISAAASDDDEAECPETVDGVDSDASDVDDGVGPPPMVPATESDESDAMPRRKTTTEIEAEYAVPEEVASSGRRKYTFKKRAKRIVVGAKRDTSTQAGRASAEAAKSLEKMRRCTNRCCVGVKSADLEVVVVKQHHQFCSRAAVERT